DLPRGGPARPATRRCRRAGPGCPGQHPRPAFEAKEVEEAERCFEIADRLSAGLGQPALRFGVVYSLAGWRIAVGRFSEAERLLFEARELGHVSGQPEADRFFAIQLWCLGLAQGP